LTLDKQGITTMRKRRTRQHQIEDLSYNYVEKQVLEAFCTMERFFQGDYGYDAYVRTFNEAGEVENGEFFIQVKATEKLNYSRKHKGYELALEKRDLELWLNEKSPVIVVLYEASTNRGFFINLQVYFDENRLILRHIGKYKQVFIPTKNAFVPDVIREIRMLKNKII
jgi:Domain of unknown function (DUF4365)